MEILPSIASFALPATVLLLLSFVWMRVRQRSQGRRSASRDALDTVAAWPPEAARILTIDERQAYELLRRAMPGFLVLAQVPIARFIRVPSRHSYLDWMQRVGSLSADLLLCDAGSRVLAVIDIRAVQESERSRRRHERMTRVLTASGIQVHTWREGQLPSINEARNALAVLAGAATATVKGPVSRPMPLIPVADISELLLEGDHRAAMEAGQEPVPSGFYEEMEAADAVRR